MVVTKIVTRTFREAENRVCGRFKEKANWKFAFMPLLQNPQLSSSDLTTSFVATLEGVDSVTAQILKNDIVVSEVSFFQILRLLLVEDDYDHFNWSSFFKWEKSEKFLRFEDLVSHNLQKSENLVYLCDKLKDDDYEERKFRRMIEDQVGKKDLLESQLRLAKESLTAMTRSKEDLVDLKDVLGRIQRKIDREKSDFALAQTEKWAEQNQNYEIRRKGRVKEQLAGIQELKEKSKTLKMKAKNESKRKIVSSIGLLLLNTLSTPQNFFEWFFDLTLE